MSLKLCLLAFISLARFSWLLLLPKIWKWNKSGLPLYTRSKNSYGKSYYAKFIFSLWIYFNDVIVILILIPHSKWIKFFILCPVNQYFYHFRTSDLYICGIFVYTLRFPSLKVSKTSFIASQMYAQAKKTFHLISIISENNVVGVLHWFFFLFSDYPPMMWQTSWG